MIEQTIYNGLFNGLKMRMRHYRAIFAKDDPSSKAVMADLAKFCRLLSTTHEPNHDDGLILEGRRQVLLRILQHIGMTPETLFTIMQGLSESERAALFDNTRSTPLVEEPEVWQRQY